MVGCAERSCTGPRLPIIIESVWRRKQFYPLLTIATLYKSDAAPEHNSLLPLIPHWSGTVRCPDSP